MVPVIGDVSCFWSPHRICDFALCDESQKNEDFGFTGFLSADVFDFSGNLLGRCCVVFLRALWSQAPANACSNLGLQSLQKPRLAGKNRLEKEIDSVGTSFYGRTDKFHRSTHASFISFYPNNDCNRSAGPSQRSPSGALSL